MAHVTQRTHIVGPLVIAVVLVLATVTLGSVLSAQSVPAVPYAITSDMPSRNWPPPHTTIQSSVTPLVFGDLPAMDAEALRQLVIEEISKAKRQESVAVYSVFMRPDGISGVQLQNAWLLEAFSIRREPVATGASGQLQSIHADDIKLATFIALRPAPLHQIESVLQTLGVNLAVAYTPGTAPYFNNGSGLVWDSRNRRYLFVVSGVDDFSLNRCFSAVIDIGTATLRERSETPCVVE